VDAAMGRSSRRCQLPWGRAPRALLRVPGSATGTSTSSSSALASCSRIAGRVAATMIAGSLLLVSARGDRGWRLRPSRRSSFLGAGRVPGPAGLLRVGGKQHTGGLLLGHLGESQAQLGLGNEGELFS
jgi:hypothetical protein